MIAILISIGLGLYGVVATLALVNQIKRVNRLETIANTAVASMEEVDRRIRESEKLLNNPRLQEAFEHDDEVGGFFRNIEAMQKIISSYVETEHERIE